MAGRYDRNATGEVLFNLTDKFHLCGLIERAASLPKSGATHRRKLSWCAVNAAKAQFCRVHRVAHPSVWEWEQRRSPNDVRVAMAVAANG